MQSVFDIDFLPKPYDDDEASRQLTDFKNTNNDKASHYNNNATYLLRTIFGSSPYLSKLLFRHHEIFNKFVEQGADSLLENTLEQLRYDYSSLQNDKINIQTIMQLLRINKGKIALLTALADISGHWHVSKVTQALSEFADIAVTIALSALFKQAVEKKQISLADDLHSTIDAPTDSLTISPDAKELLENSGIFALGMGKLGAHDLNYSSDIDLILLYNPDKVTFHGRHSLQHHMGRMAHDLVSLLQDRTIDGYVFRTDLRLRPDPSSTSPMMSVGAAISYYETVGQNWERAAMIKARVIAGDMQEGADFIKSIQPFMWRRHLDFAAIADILSIKRQMNQGDDDEIVAAGHDIKIGYGGIREIEFFTQLHQLIWGGKHIELRGRNTVDMLRSIKQLELIDAQTIDQLIQDYYYLRKIEHRIQMIADQQTHTIPEALEDIDRIAIFSGYKNRKSFISELEYTLNFVHKSYTKAFEESSPSPLSGKGSLVFTGVEHDKSTLKTLAKMNYRNPEAVSLAIQSWHRGERRCTKTSHSRAILTELVPAILDALSATINPDNAFKRFDQFIGNLPAGIQLFSLFNSNPRLLKIIAKIMGSAPALGEILSHSPYLLDTVLSHDFYSKLPQEEALRAELDNMLSLSRDEEQAITILKQFQQEKQFQLGIQLINDMVSVDEAGSFLTLIADLIVQYCFVLVREIFEQRHGVITGDGLAIISLGKQGSHELTFGSDLDLTFIYDANSGTESDGSRPLSTSIYFNRLAQRLVGILEAKTRYGQLYEVDTRLRPYGKDSPLAITTEAFTQYYQKEAWIFEYLALTRARTVYCSPQISDEIATAIKSSILYSSDKGVDIITAAISTMRDKVAEHYDDKNIWNIKYHSGGMMDADFVVQYLTLIHSKHCPEILDSTQIEYRMNKLSEADLVDSSTINTLLKSRDFITKLLFYLRLCSDGTLNEKTAAEGIRHLLSTVMQCDNFAELRQQLLDEQAAIVALCKKYNL